MRTSPTMADPETLARITDVLAGSSLENTEVTRDERGFGEIAFDFEADTYEDAVELGHRALWRAVVDEGGIKFSFFHSPWDARTRERATRVSSESIRYHARKIVKQRADPLAELDHITFVARMTVPPYTPYRWPETPIWPLYRRFHAIAARWEQANAGGECPPELRQALAAEVLAEAQRLLADQP
ncbi:MAG TPA: hypothetical protein VGH92_10625 [Gaiellaceae bacterium]